MKTPKVAKVLTPVNQKSVYASFGLIYEQIMNDVIPLEKAEIAVQALSGMNKTYALEIKRAEVERIYAGEGEKVEIRTIESKPFNLLVS
jgi:short subunit fatty acids transporter